jgi:hypothetical protein
MESKLAAHAKRQLAVANLRLTPEQRLDAFVVHCRLMMDLYLAGQRLRGTAPRSPR